MSQKIGRNDPCPCGSGKKYKQCCASSGAADEREEKGHDGAVKRAIDWLMSRRRTGVASVARMEAEGRNPGGVGATSKMFSRCMTPGFRYASSGLQ